MPHNLQHIKKCPVCDNEVLTRMQDYARCAICGWDTKCGPNHVEELKKQLKEKELLEFSAKQQLPSSEDLDQVAREQALAALGALPPVAELNAAVTPKATDGFALPSKGKKNR